jgi:hypothetical protein
MNVQHHKRCAMQEHILTARQTGSTPTTVSHQCPLKEEQNAKMHASQGALLAEYNAETRKTNESKQRRN